MRTVIPETGQSWETLREEMIEFGRGGLLRTFYCEPTVLANHRFNRSVLIEKQVPLVVLSGVPGEQRRSVLDGPPSREARKSRLDTPPGHRLALIYRFLFTPRVCERVFDQILHDMREEYCESLSAGRDQHARWVWIRGVGAVWLGMLMAVWAGVASQVCRVIRSA